MKASSTDSPPVRVFISATSDDLGSVREIVKQGLLTMQCLPMEQANFAPDYREVGSMLEDRIGSCDAVLHLVGLRYGAEPNPATLPMGTARRSFTQMEADTARRLGRKLYVFLCPDDFPYDRCESESEEKFTLQRAYREEVAGLATLHTKVNDRHDVATRVRELQLDLENVRQRFGILQRRSLAFAAGVILLLTGLSAAIWWSAQRMRDDVTELKTQVKETAASATLDPVSIKKNLQEHIRARAAEEIAKLDPVREWEKVMELEKKRDQQLNDSDHLLDSLAKAFATKEANETFSLASRILAERGVAEALRFLESKNSAREAKLALLKRGREITEQDIRELLREKLLIASLLEKNLKYDEAEDELRAVVQDGGRWPEPRRELTRLLLARGQAIEPKAGNRKVREAVEFTRGTLALCARENAPLEWAYAKADLSKALAVQAGFASGDDCDRLSRQGEMEVREAMSILTADQHPEEWAWAQTHLGGLLSQRGSNHAGEARKKLLAEAQAAFHAASRIYTRERSPQAWADTQATIANTLLQEAFHALPSEAEQLVDTAARIYRSVLEFYPRDTSPEAWAWAQASLASVLSEQGRRADPVVGPQFYVEAVAALRAALTVFTRDHFPQRWADTNHALAGALSSLAEAAAKSEGVVALRIAFPTPGEVTENSQSAPPKLHLPQFDEAALRGLRKEALDAHRASLQVFNREHSPGDWASAQNSLGLLLKQRALYDLEAEETLEALAEAIAAFRSALEVLAPGHMDWGMAQGNLGEASGYLADRLDGEATKRVREDQLGAYRLALQVFNKEHTPENWADTQKHLAQALASYSKADPPHAERCLRESVAAYRSIIEVYRGDTFRDERYVALVELWATLLDLREVVSPADRENIQLEADRVRPEWEQFVGKPN